MEGDREDSIVNYPKGLRLSETVPPRIDLFFTEWLLFASTLQRIRVDVCVAGTNANPPVFGNVIGHVNSAKVSRSLWRGTALGRSLITQSLITYQQ